MIYPAFEEAILLTKDYNKIPIAYEIYADTETPINLFLKFKEDKTNCFLLESVNHGDQRGRYSFIGLDYDMELVVKDYQVTLKKASGETEKKEGSPQEVIRELMQANKGPRIKNMPKFSGGLVGYLAYDSVRYIEKKLSSPPEDDLNMPDAHFMLYNELIAFDHVKQKIVVIVNADTKGIFEENYNKAVARAKEIAKSIKQLTPNIPRQTEEGSKSELLVKSNITKDQYIENVKKAKQHILDGDIFQIVLSQRFEINNPPNAFDTYRILRITNPSPYMYYFKFSDYEIVGSSPEKLIEVLGKQVSIRPIAGTAKRGMDEKEDAQIENKLINDEKERAEHTMLVDLARNDIGKVCKVGTVQVTDFMRVEKYSKVIHLVSDVSGELREDQSSLDALAAALPAGTLSGAPKVKAMELIDEIEEVKRGLYGGTVGYISFHEDMDTCIAIRTVLFKNNKAYIQAGAGIVADSDPEKEYEETENKAKAVINAIMEARDLG